MVVGATVGGGRVVACSTRGSRSIVRTGGVAATALEPDDEHDDDDDRHEMIQAAPNGDFLVNAATPVAEFNERFDAELSALRAHCAAAGDSRGLGLLDHLEAWRRDLDAGLT